MASVGCLFEICLWSLSRMVWSASDVFEFGLNAYCVEAMMLCLVQCVMIWLLMILSSIFPMIGSSDMGR